MLQSSPEEVAAKFNPADPMLIAKGLEVKDCWTSHRSTFGLNVLCTTEKVWFIVPISGIARQSKLIFDSTATSSPSTAQVFTEQSGATSREGKAGLAKG